MGFGVYTIAMSFIGVIESHWCSMNGLWNKVQLQALMLFMSCVKANGYVSALD